MEKTKVFVDEFAERLVERLKEDGVAVKNYSVKEVYKINDTIHHGIVVQEEGLNCTPTIYLDQFEVDVHDGITSMDDALDEALKIYINSRQAEIVSHANNPDDLPKNAKYTIRMLNANRNKHYLENVPTRMLNDELALFVVGELPSTEENAVMSFRVSNDLLKHIGITEEELFEKAFETLKEEKFTVRPISKVLSEMCDFPELFDSEAFDPIFVATSVNKVHGAVVLARNDILSMFAKAHGDFYILPCSVHELLFVPTAMVPDNADLPDMVRTVNETTLKDEDYLSDTVYVYTEDGITVL